MLMDERNECLGYEQPFPPQTLAGRWGCTMGAQQLG